MCHVCSCFPLLLFLSKTLNINAELFVSIGLPSALFELIKKWKNLRAVHIDQIRDGLMSNPQASFFILWFTIPNLARNMHVY